MYMKFYLVQIQYNIPSYIYVIYLKVNFQSKINTNSKLAAGRQRCYFGMGTARGYSSSLICKIGEVGHSERNV